MRDAYTDQLGSIRDDLVSMSRMVGSAVTRATEALLNGDATLAEQVISLILRQAFHHLRLDLGLEQKLVLLLRHVIEQKLQSDLEISLFE